MAGARGRSLGPRIERVALPDRRVVPVAAGAHAVDVVLVAARNSSRIRNRIRRVARAQRDGRSERSIAGDESFQTAHETAGTRFLDRDRHHRLWSLLVAVVLNELIKGLDLIFLEVNSLEESVVFYEKVLGFAIESINEKSEPPMARLRAGELRITLAQHLETMLRRGRGVHFFIGVADVDEYYEQLTERGADVLPPVDEGWGGRFITLEDPDKYRFFFVTWTKETG